MEKMYKWLKEDEENVVVMHCNSGKGRAGTACCCLLMFCGLYDNMVDSAKLFGSRRFSDHKGISQPCQVRFIHYFEAFYHGVVKSPQIKILKKITIMQVPIFSNISAAGCKPYFKLFRVKGLDNEFKYTNKDNKN